MFDKVWDFLVDGKHKFSKKFLLAFFAFLSLLAIDYFFRFSDSYIAEKKIEQLGKIEEILKQDSISTQSKNELLRIEKQVINRQGFWDLSSDLISLIQITINSPKQIIKTPIATKPIDNKNLKIVEIKIERSVFWHILTSCWYLIAFMVVFPFAIISQKTENKTVMIITVEIIFAALIALVSYLFALIPVLNNPIYNYMLNLAIPILLLLLIGFFINKKQGK